MNNVFYVSRITNLSSKALATEDHALVAPESYEGGSRVTNELPH
jgi:hypothetical protein